MSIENRESTKHDNTQELLDLVAATEAQDDTPEIIKFINEFNITPSESNQIPLYKLKLLYDSWSKGNKLQSGVFKKQLGEHFKIEQLTPSFDLSLCWVECEKAEKIEEMLWQKRARLWKARNERRCEKRRQKRAKEKARLKAQADKVSGSS